VPKRDAGGDETRDRSESQRQEQVRRVDKALYAARLTFSEKRL
jgi:hypothetical protein